MEQAAGKKGAGGAQVLLSVQGLRGIAVVAVVLIHIQLYFSTKLQRPDFLPQFNIGAASVDVFFVISGFIMIYASERLFGQNGGQRIFFLRRIARIVPMYWIATTIMLAYLIVHYGGVGNAFAGAGIEYIICSYLFIPYGRPHDWGQPIQAVGWTLIFEVYFYTLFGLFVMWPRRVVALAVTAIFVAMIAIGQMFPDLPNPVRFWTRPMIIEFAFGMGIALAYRSGIRIPRALGYPAIAGGLAVLFWSWRQEHFFNLDSVERVFLWGLPAIAIVGAFALSDRPVPHNRFWRVTGFLGDASYSLYLFHTLGLGVPAMFLGRFFDVAQMPWLLLAFIVLSTMIPSLLIYLFVEKPTTEYLQRKIEGSRRSEPTGTPLVATSPP